MIVLVALGCTFAPGEPWARVVASEMELGLRPGVARDLGGGAFLTDLGFEVSPTLATGTVGAVRVQELRGAAGVEFDPTSPPDGVGLCHGGHCHMDDGRLLSYAEVEAELSGGAATFVDVLVFPVENDLPLLDPAALPLTPEDEELPLVELSQVVVELQALHLEAEVAGQAPLTIELGPTPLSVPLPVVIDRKSALELNFVLSVVDPGTLLDGVDLTQAVSAEGLAQIQENLITGADVGAALE